MSAPVKIRVAGVVGPRPVVVWPDGWPAPRVGESVSVGDEELYVRVVEWYPHGTEETTEPFVYVVLGPSR